MDLQTKENIVSIGTALIVTLSLSAFVFFSNQAEEQKAAIEVAQKSQEELKSLPVLSEKPYINSGYISANKTNVMSSPIESSEVIGELMFNDFVKYSTYNETWLKIEGDANGGYVLSKDVNNEQIPYESFQVDKTSGFKSYMDYRSITSKDSPQYELQMLYAETNKYGIRTVDGRYCVAVGSHFTSEIGQYFDLILADGNTIKCVLADQKADVHTDVNNIVTLHNGCMSEFIVDSNMLNDDVRMTGDISFCGYDWDNFIVQVRVYDKNVFDEE